MDLCKDLKAFINRKKGENIKTNNLFLCEIGTYLIKENSKGHYTTTFDPQGIKIMQELTPIEVQQYLKRCFGSEKDNLPEYHNKKNLGVRYFTYPNDTSIVVPQITSQQAQKIQSGTIFAITRAKNIITIADLPQFTTMDELLNLEKQLNRSYKTANFAATGTPVIVENETSINDISENEM